MASSSTFRVVRRIIYVIVAIGAIVFVGMRFFGQKKEPEYLTAKVERGAVTQTVTLTGAVQPDARYHLQFQKPGKMSQIAVKIGDFVRRGDVLAILQNNDIYYQIEAQKAALRFAQSNLVKALSGPKNEEIELQKLKINQAETEASAASGVRYHVAEIARKAFDVPALDFKKSMELERQLEETDANMEKARLNVVSTEQQLNLLNAKPRNSDIAPLKAQINQAWQNVKLAEYQLEQSKIVAPVDGIVTDVALNVGESASGQPVITLDTQHFYIKVLVSEADAGKIWPGQSVNMTFDAFEQRGEFSGTVREVYPAETVVQGVVYYLAKIDFDSTGTPVKAGMTANLTVRVREKNNALVVPARAVEYEKNQPYIQVIVYENGRRQQKIERRNLQIGVQGDENIEIISGVLEGEEVVTFVKK